MRIVLLASGKGTLASAIIDAVKSGNLSLEIAGVISDKDSPVLSIADRAGIPHYFLPLRGERSQWDQELINITGQLRPDLVVSVGFMRILAPSFIQRFRAINSHPSLLPQFPGAHAVRDALLAGNLETGTTIHWIDEGVDTGTIIATRRVPILPGDSEVTLHERIKIEERALIVEVLNSFVENGLPEQ
jgi:phosphoribosylglycinamide formyltransferase 1